MTDSANADDNPILNASALIDRFGGIRPMAGKLGVPVTTVQGWKKRDVIPGSRRDDILNAALRNNIDLGDFLIVLTKKQSASNAAAAPRPVPTATVGESRIPTALVGVAVILSALACGGLAAVALRKPEFATAPVTAPAQNPQEKTVVADLARTIDEIKINVEDLKKQAETMQGPVEDRIKGLEENLQTLTTQNAATGGAMGLANWLQRLTILQQSPEGQGMLSLIAKQIAGQPADDTVPFEQKIADLKSSDPAIAQAFEGVAPEDMKAAVMLMGFAQLRQSLMRDGASFDGDLALLRQALAKDDPALAESIDRLAPQAKTGVLTPAGLSREFRGLAGDLVTASLRGENVSVEEKAKARLGEVFKLDKNGQRISGTETQIAVAAAQKKLDEGDIHGATEILKTLDGDAAEKAQPFIQQAEMTLLAQQVQSGIGNNLLSLMDQRLASTGAGQPLAAGGIQSIIGQVKQMIPAQGMTGDASTGFRMYKPAPTLLPRQLNGHHDSPISGDR